MRLRLIALIAASAALPTALGGPLTYAVCQTGCNVGAATCYAAAGLTFGTVLAPLAPAAIVTCNTVQAACMVSCAASLVAPTP